MLCRHPEHLAMFTLPILQEMLVTMRSKSAGLSEPSGEDLSCSSMAESPPDGAQDLAISSTLSVFSCHDITLYGLLHALGAQHVVENWDLMTDEGAAAPRDLFWPYYGEIGSFWCHSLVTGVAGSNLMFELIHPTVRNSSNCSGSEVLVRVFLDLKPLRFNLQYIDTLLEQHADDQWDVEGLETPRKTQYTNEFTIIDLAVLVEKMSAVEYSFFRKHHGGVNTHF